MKTTTDPNHPKRRASCSLASPPWHRLYFFVGRLYLRTWIGLGLG